MTEYQRVLERAVWAAQIGRQQAQELIKEIKENGFRNFPR